MTSTGHSLESVHPGATRMPVLSVRGLSVDYATAGRPVQAVRELDLDLLPGQIYGIAGESGSGKSTLLFALSRLLRPPAAVTAGTVAFRGQDGVEVDVLNLKDEALSAFRWSRLSLVFQSALNALNPVLSVHDQIKDVLLRHRPQLGKAGARQRALELLQTVGVQADRLEAYPHQLSGGMRQRVMIAIALALDPDVILMDEPTTALDVVTQRQILSEILRLRHERGFAVVFITHDISLLLEIADVISVMYAGRIVETAAPDDLLADPKHPYTQGLLNSFPPMEGPRQHLTGIPGSPPDLRDVPTGCSFQPRCPRAFEPCPAHRPLLTSLPTPTDRHPRQVACFLHEVPAASADQPTFRRRP